MTELGQIFNDLRARAINELRAPHLPAGFGNEEVVFLAKVLVMPSFSDSLAIELYRKSGNDSDEQEVFAGTVTRWKYEEDARHFQSEVDTPLLKIAHSKGELFSTITTATLGQGNIEYPAVIEQLKSIIEAAKGSPAGIVLDGSSYEIEILSAEEKLRADFNSGSVAGDRVDEWVKSILSQAEHRS